MQNQDLTTMWKFLEDDDDLSTSSTDINPDLPFYPLDVSDREDEMIDAMDDADRLLKNIDNNIKEEKRVMGNMKNIHEDIRDQVGTLNLIGGIYGWVGGIMKVSGNPLAAQFGDAIMLLGTVAGNVASQPAIKEAERQLNEVDRQLDKNRVDRAELQRRLQDVFENQDRSYDRIKSKLKNNQNHIHSLRTQNYKLRLAYYRKTGKGRVPSVPVWAFREPKSSSQALMRQISSRLASRIS